MKYLIPSGVVWVVVSAMAVGGIELGEMELGSEPESVFVIEGDFKVSEVDGERVIEMGTEPVEECMMLFGETLRGSASIRGKVKAGKKGRSYPTFGVGLYGVSGYRLRVVPVRDEIEIVEGDDVVASGRFDWSGQGWTWLELSIQLEEDGGWVVEGRAWEEGFQPPDEALARHEFDAERVMGKAGILGTPYTGLPTYFGELEVVEGK
ncbi:MAG: hypothetical protein AAGD22_13045 [Verrucomicrobiota bacterium]